MGVAVSLFPLHLSQNRIESVLILRVVSHAAETLRNGDPDLPFTCFRIVLILTMTFISIAYRSQDGGIVMFGKLIFPWSGVSTGGWNGL